ncbi:DUF2852 domain-containing protein [Pseudoroseicyclus tamaricis]|uniref:DUF2852 domain-containing protein n=1 Tax=Pseudoroseicyclus tamaricis TaxID=2705421 RepID=UPI00193FBB45
MSRRKHTPDEAEFEGAFPLKVLSIIFFTAFAIVATVLAFVAFWPAGLALGLLVAWKGFNGGLYGPHREFALRVLSLIFFTGYAIVAISVGFAHEALAGLVLAGALIWQGFNGLAVGASQGASSRAPGVADVAPEAETDDWARGSTGRPSGNASFDAYKADMMRRLEEEQRAFEDFLARLRASKDQSEFDNFMERRAERAAAQRRAAASPMALIAPRRQPSQPAAAPQPPAARDGEVIAVPPEPQAPRVAHTAEVEDAEEVAGPVTAPVTGPVTTEEPARDPGWQAGQWSGNQPHGA